MTAGVPVDFHEAHLEGKTTEERFKSFEDILLAVRRNGIAIKGSWITEMGPGECFIVRPKENITLFPVRRQGENYFGCHPAANKKIFFYFSLQYMKCHNTCNYGNV